MTPSATQPGVNFEQAILLRLEDTQKEILEQVSDMRGELSDLRHAVSLSEDRCRAAAREAALEAAESVVTTALEADATQRSSENSIPRKVLFLLLIFNVVNLVGLQNIVEVLSSDTARNLIRALLALA